MKIKLDDNLLFIISQYFHALLFRFYNNHNPPICQLAVIIFSPLAFDIPDTDVRLAERCLVTSQPVSNCLRHLNTSDTWEVTEEY